jgi:hypothetical protein
VSSAETTAIVEGYSDAQLKALKVGLLACGFIALASLLATRNLPRRRLGEQGEDEDAASGAAVAHA